MKNTDSLPNQETPQQGRCPRCGKVFLYTSLAEHRSFPFCSQRCRDVDFGNWLLGNYALSAPLQSQEDGEPEDTGPASDST